MDDANEIHNIVIIANPIMFYQLIPGNPLDGWRSVQGKGLGSELETGGSGDRGKG
jgi:hypothetical protein